MRGAFFMGAAALVAAMLAAPSLAQTGADKGAALTGIVTSAQEGAMEGVLVTAKRDGATISTTVVTDEKGQYRFPAARLPAGHYTLKIRAEGYDLASGNAADVASGKAATANLTLKPTSDLEAQLTNAEWLMSMPGTDEQKRPLGDCTNCHTLRLITRSRFTEKDFERLIPLMGTYAPGSQPGRHQIIPPGPRGNRGISDEATIKSLATYLATINLSQTGQQTYALKTLPRPSGRATHVIMTTYDLPRPNAEPHDAIMVRGHIYYSDFGSQILGELDPATGQVTDYPLPVLKPAEPKGTLALQADKAGNVWTALMYQGGIAKLDAVTKKVTAYSIPDEWQNASTQETFLAVSSSDVDGKVWTNDQSDHSFLRFDLPTGKYEKLPLLKDQNGETISAYGLPADAKNNIFPLEFSGARTKIGRIDAQTQKLTSWKSSLGQARARRGAFDDQGILWFGEFGSDAIGRLDPVTGTLQEWKTPLPWTMPYDAIKANKTGDIWTGSMLNDRITRFNPQTMLWIDYLTPDEINIRRVFFDDATNSFWAGSNHKPTIVKLEPLD